MRADFFADAARFFCARGGGVGRGAPIGTRHRTARQLLDARLMTDPLHARVRSEYREMPGLRLTPAQAARLFNIEPAHCTKLLNALVSDGALWTNGREYFDANVGRRFA